MRALEQSNKLKTPVIIDFFSNILVHFMRHYIKIGYLGLACNPKNIRNTTKMLKKEI